MNMKYLAHVPTEQYGFISVEVEGSPEEAVEAYKALQGAWQPGPGLSDSQFNAWLDSYLAGKPGTVDEWSQMSDKQKVVINEIKKSRKRNTN